MPVPDLTRSADEQARDVRLERLERSPDVLVAHPNSPFFLVFYPRARGNWSAERIEPGDGVADDEVGVWWLPVLQNEPIIPGLNGHRTLKGDNADPRDAYEQAHQAIARAGGIVLPKELGYMKERPCVHPLTQRSGVRYFDAWSKPRVTLEGQRLKFDFDRQRFNRWRLSLLRDGLIPPPLPHMIDMTRARIASRVERRAALVGLDAEVKQAHVGAARDADALAQQAQVATPDTYEKTKRKPKGSH